MLTMITMETKNNKTHCLDFASGDLAVLLWYGWLLTVLGYLLPRWWWWCVTPVWSIN